VGRLPVNRREEDFVKWLNSHGHNAAIDLDVNSGDYVVKIYSSTMKETLELAVLFRQIERTKALTGVDFPHMIVIPRMRTNFSYITPISVMVIKEMAHHFGKMELSKISRSLTTVNEGLSEITCPHNEYFVENNGIISAMVDFEPVTDEHHNEVVLYKLKWDQI
jgi:hypothetical protein